MNIRERETIRLPNDLYDRIEAMAQQRGATVHDVTEEALRFWVSLTSEDEQDGEMRATLTPEQERLVFYFLRFLKRGDHDSVAIVQHAIEGWRKRDSVTSH